MTNRRSYRGLMDLPAWLLVDSEGVLRASCRAATKKEAQALFIKQYGRYSGRVVSDKQWRKENPKRP